LKNNFGAVIPGSNFEEQYRPGSSFGYLSGLALGQLRGIALIFFLERDV